MKGRLTEINGPLVRAQLPQATNGEQVRIGKQGIIGEVIGRDGDYATIQVYEETETLKPGEEVIALGYPLSVELGPGLMGNIFDGIQRPLETLAQSAGDYIPRGSSIAPLDHNKLWHFQPNPDISIGDHLLGGEVLGKVEETESVMHHILVPPDTQGTLLKIQPQGDYCLDDDIAWIQSGQDEQALNLFHRWPVRKPRPYKQRDHAIAPLITGQRIFDTFFPLLKGGKAAVPGPFGAGKTIVQQQIARWSNADIVIYVGCGERGNELVEILTSFPDIVDPKSKRSLMERTILVANTSNMPVVAREASIYVGVTIAEYYRDQGLDVVMVADSTSRWAEALREVSGRLGQMPVEEGYPAYLASRLSAFYERAGRVHTLSDQRGSVTLIGAVSPPGGDFSEPVTGHTKEIVETFWALSKELADARHYPAVSWTESFSGYVTIAAQWWIKQTDEEWQQLRTEALNLLARDAELMRIVNLVGPEALSPEQRWILDGANLIKEGILQQSALDEVDSYASPEKQYLLLKIMLLIYHRGIELLKLDMPVQELNKLSLLGKAKRCKSTYSSEQSSGLRDFIDNINQVFDGLKQTYSENSNKV